MTDIIAKVRTTYQAPVRGARIRTRKADAYADWAHALVRARLDERCGCEPGSEYEAPWTCPGHRGRTVEVRCLGEPIGYEAVHEGIFDAGVRAGMRRRLAKMLRAGWRP